MDGSAAQFVAAIDAVGLVTQARRRKYLKVLKSVYVEHGRSRAELKPAEAGFRMDVEIDFEVATIGRQRRAFDVDPQTFRSEVAKARTVMVNKRSMASGYAGLDNPLFYMDKTMMVFGDAKKVVEDMVKALD